MRPLILILSLWVLAPVRAQLLDSIALFLQEPPRPVLRLDVRGSFVSNQNVRLVGVKVGLEHARRFQYGIGYTFLFTPVRGQIQVEGLGTTEGRLRVGYITPYVDYAFYQRGPWEVRLPVQIGLGAGSVVYDDADGKTQKWARTGLITYEPTMTVQYRFLKYFAVGAGWGFRLVIQTGDDLGEQLNAPIYTLGFRIFFEDLWRDMEQKE
ncbi:MAG: hypothetical protein ABI432_06785 [Flavobacteriales bacterium]